MFIVCFSFFMKSVYFYSSMYSGKPSNIRFLFDGGFRLAAEELFSK